MNKSPQHQNKHRHQTSCQSFPQQVKVHFRFPLRVTAVPVIAAPVPGTVVFLLNVIMCAEGFYPPDSVVALHFWASGTSAAGVALRRRCCFFFPFLDKRRIALRDKLGKKGRQRRGVVNMNFLNFKLYIKLLDFKDTEQGERAKVSYGSVWR